MTEVEVAVAIYGDLDVWLPRARQAQASVAEQTVPTWCHVVAGADLADARNTALEIIDTPYAIFLDADDALDPRYVEHMLAGDGDVRWPSVRYPDGRVVAEASNPLPEWNQVVIGAMARTELLRDVGGFADLPVLEDYDLWCRCWAAGADMRPCLDAVYEYNHQPTGRSATGQAIHDRWWAQIRGRYR